MLDPEDTLRAETPGESSPQSTPCGSEEPMSATSQVLTGILVSAPVVNIVHLKKINSESLAIKFNICALPLNASFIKQ